MCAAVRPERWDDVREVCERWGLPVAIIGRVTDDGDIAIVEGGLDADGRPARRAEIARIPAAALTSDAIVHERLAPPPAHRRAAPAPGAPVDAQRPAAGAGHGPGRGPAGAARLGQPRRRAARSSSSTTRRSGPNTVAGPGPRRRGPARQGHDQGARRDDRRQPGGRRARSVARRGAERRRGDPQRRDHRRPAARRHELPQLRRPDPARGVLAAQRGRARPRRRVPRARPAGHRRQRLALQRVARRARSPRRPRSASSACSTTSRRSSGRPSCGRRRDPARRRGDARARRAPRTRRSPAPPPRTARRRSTSPARRRSRRSSARRSRAGSSRRPRTSRAAGWRSPSPRCAMWSGLGASVRLAVGDSPAVELFGESPSRLVVTRRPRYAPGARRCSPASTACRSRRSARSAATASSSSSAGAGATRRRRGARQPASPTRSRCRSRDLRHAWDHGLPAPSAGRADAHVRRVRRRAAAGAEPTEAAAIAALGLFALQHRGQESAGLAVSDGEQLMLYKDLGMISTVLDERRLPSLRGQLAIAHCRYSTTGSTIWENAQPTYRLGPAPRDRDRPQRQPRQHPRAARASSRAAGRACRPRPTRSC